MSTIPSPASGQLPFSSTVPELPLPVALERLFRARSTGLLVIDARQGRHVVFVREGYPVAVELPGSFELLGKVLVEMKILDPVAYETTLKTPPPDGVLYGEHLLALKLVTEAQLLQALKAQVRRKLHRLFFLSEGPITFTSGDHHEGLQRNESLRIHPWRANYHGVRSAWNADRLRHALAPLAGKPVTTTFSTEELARFGLGAEDGKAGQLLRTASYTIDTLSAATGLPVQPVSALLYAVFVSAGLDDGKLPSVAPTALTSGTTPGFAVPAAALNATPAPAPVVAAPTPAPAAPRTEIERAIIERAAKVEGEDLFAVLGVERTATAEQVKTAYLEGARRYHPDRLVSQNLTHLRAEVEKIFRRLSEAQSALLDDEKRAQYRKTLDSPTSKEDAAAHQQALSILNAEMAFRRGQNALKKNDLGAALRDFESALAAQPEEGEHVTYTAWTRHCLQQLSSADAKAEVQRGIKLSPKAASGHYLLGMLQKEEAAFDAALGSFRKAVALDARQFEAEQEIRVLEVRLARGAGEKRGLFDRFRKPGK